jgi:methyl-accepting chemotaxis protein
MHGMTIKLSAIIHDVREGSTAVASAAAQLSASSQNLSQGASEQAASVEEVSASLEEMTASISQNAQNSSLMEKAAVRGMKSSAETDAAVNATVAAMKKITEKISIIEDIAYQTNLLALNAAIEAARAGDQGKGFAVVAAEVRRLAERSQAAAVEISSLAAESVSISERAGELLSALVPGIKKNFEVVQDVAAATAEQASTVKQVNKAMGQVDSVTQRNASSAEELASTAEELASQSEQLQQLMTFFRVSREQQTHPSPGAWKQEGITRPVAVQGPWAQIKPAPRANGASMGEHDFMRF